MFTKYCFFCRYVPGPQFATMLKAAVQKYPTLGGAMGWQWGSDTNGKWAAELAAVFAEADTEAAVNANATVGA